jgi:hypothetical protein
MTNAVTIRDCPATTTRLDRDHGHPQQPQQHKPSQVFLNNPPRMSDPPQTLLVTATFRGYNDEEA